MVAILNFICLFQEIEYQNNLKTIMKSNETVLDKCNLDIILKDIAVVVFVSSATCVSKYIFKIIFYHAFQWEI